MTTDSRVRRACVEDAPRLAAMGAALFRQSYGRTHPEPTLSTYLASAFDPDLWGRMLQDPRMTVLVAESADGDQIGYVQLKEGRPDASVHLDVLMDGAQPLEIVRFYVDSAWHGHGVAQRLMAACDAEARARSCDVLWLQAWQEAPQALAFYRKSGFRVIGSATFQFGERRDDDFLLARPIEDALMHRLSADDRNFREDFEACRIPPAAFDHRAHVRLAYVYLVDHGVDAAADSLRTALGTFIRHNGIAESKYHETLTRAWVLAVRHFMESSPPAGSADEFMSSNPRLLDSKIMMTHYSVDTLFSADARARFVEPDLQAIPRHRDVDPVR